MDAQVLGISVDSVPCLKAWADSLGVITYPLLSDFYPHGEVAISYGVLRSEGHSERALFVIDKQGIIRYVDVHDIDDQPDNEVLFGELAKLEPEKAAAYKPAEVHAEPIAELEADVVMYCTPWCPACKRARLYLNENNIPFVEVDISRDRGAAAKVRAWANGYETTPIFNIKGQIIVDFDRSILEQTLGIK